MVELHENGDIVADGTVVGYLGWEENVLVDIKVEEGWQGCGYGTEAVSLLVERLRASGYEEVVTTTVVSDAMETVLQQNGFEPDPPEPVWDPAEFDGVDSSDVPTEETGVWRRDLC